MNKNGIGDCIEVMKKNNNTFLFPAEFYAGISMNNKLYCVDCFCNVIISIDLDKDELSCKGSLKDEIFLRSSLFIDSLIWKNKIVFIPYYAKYVHIYDVINNTDEIIKFGEENELKMDKYRVSFWDAGKCYFLPHVGDYILELDLDNKMIKRKMNVGQKLKEKGLLYESFSVSDVYQYGSNYYTVMYDHPYIVKINLRDNKADVIRLAGIQSGLMSIVGIHNKIYILSRNNIVVVYNLDEKRIEKLFNLNLKGDIGLHKGMVCEGHIYFMGIARQDFIDYEIESNHAVYSNFNVEWNLDGKENEQFMFVCSINKTKVLLITDYLRIVVYDLMTGECHINILKYDREDIKSKIAENFCCRQGQVCYEYMEWDFILWLQYCKADMNRKQWNDIGVRVWNNLKTLGEN